MSNIRGMGGLPTDEELATVMPEFVLEWGPERMFECSKCDFQFEIPILHNDPKVHPLYPCSGKMMELIR